VVSGPNRRHMTLLDILKQHSFTAGLADAHLVTLSNMVQEVTFRENDVILEAGQQSRYFYLLLSGSVCIQASAPAFAVSVQALGAGEAFGWSSLLDNHDTLFQVRARERSTALCLDGEKLCDAFAADSGLAAELLRRALRLAARRLQATETRFGELCGLRMPKMT
jgi:CRP/FNR family transcriptional regulator, cyclic AMP receptor protein